MPGRPVSPRLLAPVVGLIAGACASPAPGPSVSQAAPDLVDAAARDAANEAPRPTARSPAAAPAPSTVADAAAPPDAGAVDAARQDASTAPRARVVTIGMHVGGGPYDEITKEPLRSSVEPRFAELAACFRHAPAGTGTIDAGVDLLVEATGGRARVSNPRSLLKDDAFVACVVAFFESVEFQRPRNGRTTVSYSVRFTPRAGAASR